MLRWRWLIPLLRRRDRIRHSRGCCRRDGWHWLVKRSSTHATVARSDKVRECTWTVKRVLGGWLGMSPAAQLILNLELIRHKLCLLHCHSFEESLKSFHALRVHVRSLAHAILGLGCTHNLSRLLPHLGQVSNHVQYIDVRLGNVACRGELSGCGASVFLAHNLLRTGSEVGSKLRTKCIWAYVF